MSGWSGALCPPLSLQPHTRAAAAGADKTERHDADAAARSEQRGVCRWDAAAVMFFPRSERHAGAAATDAGGPGRG